MREMTLIALVMSSFVAPRVAKARVVRFVVSQKRAFAGGKPFGHAGPYQRLDGTAYFEVDPTDPLNAVIVNLDKAPRNAKGMVEFSAPFWMLKPVDVARGNHKIWYGVNNRGNSNELEYRSFPAPLYPPTNDPMTVDDIGNNILLKQGYTFVDAGWQGDVVNLNHQLVPDLPVAKQPDGTPIVNAVRIEYSDRSIPTRGTFTLPLEGDPAFRSYATADTDTAHSTLTVRDSVSGMRAPVPPDHWAFGKCSDGRESLVPSGTDICLFDGFRADKLYELIYPAKGPKVMGLGYAVPRDLGSFLRYQTRDDAGNPNPLASSAAEVGIRRAYVCGRSSTGMYMRDWLYLGFNEDESHRKVFDAAHINVSGTGRLFANVEFADPNTYSREDDRHDFLSGSYPPLTFAVTTDPISGVRDGILKRPATDPLVFEVDTANEFWNMRASLNVADGAGDPVPLPKNVRLYFLSSYSHLGADTGLFGPTGAAVSVRGNCQYPTHKRGFLYASEAPTMRALVVALDEWADKAIEPPKSNYPQLADRTLVTEQEARSAFPQIPGVKFPAVINELRLLNFGPEFNSWGGTLTLLPPVAGAVYQLFVPKPDSDGLDVAGIRTMEIRAPLGTNVGWNLRDSGAQPPNLCGLVGSYFPFAATRAERVANGDPRPSLEERYHDHQGFVSAVENAAKQLVAERLLLAEDADTWIESARSSNVLK